MRKVLFTFCVFFFLAGCDSTNDGQSDCDDGDASCPPPENPDPSILGLWDSGSVQNNLEDASFTFIGTSDNQPAGSRAAGEYLIYDYQQDDFGTGENCYTLFEGTIRRISQSFDDYIVPVVPADPEIGGFSNGATIFLQDGVLNFQLEAGMQQTWPPVTGQTIDDLILCE